MTPREMREKRGKLATEIRQLADLTVKHRDFTADEREKWDRLNREYDELTELTELTCTFSED